MRGMKPHMRVIVGRNITLTAGTVYAATRALTYATMDPADLNQAQLVITADGRALGAWAAIWLMTAVFCIADMVNRHTRYGLSLVVGLALAWGLGYLGVWISSAFTDIPALATAIGWMTPAALVFGFLLKVTALQDMIRQKAETDE